MKILNPSVKDKEILKTIFEKGVRMGRMKEQKIKKGYWWIIPREIRYCDDEPPADYRFKCSECNSELPDCYEEPTPHCPECGADMTGEIDGEILCRIR